VASKMCFVKATGEPEILTRTKLVAFQLLKEWRVRYEEQGWFVYSTAKGTALIARPPGWNTDPKPSSRHAISFRSS
jgi:hypothetical protein